MEMIMEEATMKEAEITQMATMKEAEITQMATMKETVAKIDYRS
jgi:hypothetical protein